MLAILLSQPLPYGEIHRVYLTNSPARWWDTTGPDAGLAARYLGTINSALHFRHHRRTPDQNTLVSRLHLVPFFAVTGILL